MGGCKRISGGGSKEEEEETIKRISTYYIYGQKKAKNLSLPS